MAKVLYTRLDYEKTRKAIEKKFGLLSKNYISAFSEYDTGDWHYEFTYSVGGVKLIAHVIVWCGDFNNPVISDSLVYRKPEEGLPF